MTTPSRDELTERARLYKAAGRRRNDLLAENPPLLDAVVSGGHFGGDFSIAIANRMYSRTEGRAIDDAVNGTNIEQHGDGVYLIRFPIVNVAAFDTDEGLVLFDAGYAPAGPALLKAVEQISDKPVHTVVFTHFHCDHAFGAWSLFEAGHDPNIVATAAFRAELQADIDTWGLNSRYTNQWPDDVPVDWDRAFTPTQTFHDSTSLHIGGVEFVLTHTRGETADQLWGWVPGKSAVVSADYYQPFLPNAGNGKRRQRHPGDWADALTAMADCDPGVVLPMHGPALTERDDIQDRLRAHADILNSVVEQVLAGLNAGEHRRDVVDAVRLPAQHADRPDIEETYVTLRDIANMAAHQYTGWWDDIPSHWAPPTLVDEAGEVARLAGGPAALIARALEVKESNIRLSCQLADWAYLADPSDGAVREGASQIYAYRIETDGTPTQEALVYLDHLAELRPPDADER